MIASLKALALVLSTAVRVSPWQSLMCLGEAAGKVLMGLQPAFLGLLAAGIVQGDRRLLTTAIGGILLSTGVNYGLQFLGTQARIRQLTDVGHDFDLKVARISAGIPTLDHLEGPDFLDRTQILRDNSGILAQAFNMLLNTLNNLAWSITSVVVALTADWRLILLALLGIPRLVAVRWFMRWDREAEEASGPPSRLAFSLVHLSADPIAGAETRVFGLQDELRRRLRDAVAHWRAPLIRNDGRTALFEGTYGVFYFGAAAAVIGWMLADAVRGEVTVAAMVVAVSVVGAMQSVSEVFVHAIRGVSTAIRNAQRFIWLRDYAVRARAAHAGTTAPPERLHDGIALEGVSYTYDGAEKPALADLDLHLPAGSTVALVGENGAGKSTLVKLLAGLYDTTEGRIVVDGTDLRAFDLAAWRERMSGAFQDHANLELVAQESVGAGDLAHVDDESEVRRALREGSGDDVLPQLPQGLATQLGTAWPDGVDLSGGQWQRLAISRGMMRRSPLLLVLDEPTSALDAATEHALFERYAQAAREAGGRGAVTLLVTHRFSTVASADLVVVLDEGRIAEIGTHAELIAGGGVYAQLYELQARGYR